ncbi:MAG TPA: sugar phosphate isomerase/epimerase, partial [Mycobacteriales bacterium]|nr:sugar phosphate isomerase/epimerase [Mycobacteriales bacterium]
MTPPRSSAPREDDAARADAAREDAARADRAAREAERRIERGAWGDGRQVAEAPPLQDRPSAQERAAADVAAAASVRVPGARVALSTASVYPESTATAFEIASRLGYDGVEVMVWGDPVSQDVSALRRLSDYHEMPILALHAPCLVITQRVWGTDPWVKLVRARDAAEEVGAETVVVHPPFRWQRDYARQFVGGINHMASETDVRFAVENMFPLRARGREIVPYAPDWDPTAEEFRHFTLDLSHTSVSQTDAFELAERMGDRLAHIHIADGRGSARDEHLVPGRGEQPCADMLEHLAVAGFDGLIVVEVSTRRVAD